MHDRHPRKLKVLPVQVDELRGSPMSVGSLEEIIDEKCTPCPSLQ